MKDRLVYFRCPKCKDLGIQVTGNKFVECAKRWCGYRFCYIRHQVKKEYYDRVWGG
jgi:hypothetical protein